MLPFIYGPSGSIEALAKAASLQVQAAEEVFKAWVGARRVEDGGHLHTSNQPDLAQFARLHEMREGPILVVQRQPHVSEGHVRDVLSPRTVLQTANQFETLAPATGQGVNPGAPQLHPDIRHL